LALGWRAVRLGPGSMGVAAAGARELVTAALHSCCRVRELVLFRLS
jgi:hypothetical protein